MTMRILKLVVGIICLFLSLYMLYESLFARLYDLSIVNKDINGVIEFFYSFSKIENFVKFQFEAPLTGGSFGFIVGMLVFTGGILYAATWNIEEYIIHTVLAVLFFIASLTGFTMCGSYTKLMVYSEWCLCCSFFPLLFILYRFVYGFPSVTYADQSDEEGISASNLKIKRAVILLISIMFGVLSFVCLVLYFINTSNSDQTELASITDLDNLSGNDSENRSVVSNGASNPSQTDSKNVPVIPGMSNYSSNYQGRASATDNIQGVQTGSDKSASVAPASDDEIQVRNISRDVLCRGTWSMGRFYFIEFMESEELYNCGTYIGDGRSFMVRSYEITDGKLYLSSVDESEWYDYEYVRFDQIPQSVQNEIKDLLTATYYYETSDTLITYQGYKIMDETYILYDADTGEYMIPSFDNR